MLSITSGIALADDAGLVKSEPVVAPAPTIRHVATSAAKPTGKRHQGPHSRPLACRSPRSRSPVTMGGPWSQFRTKNSLQVVKIAMSLRCRQCWPEGGRRDGSADRQSCEAVKPLWGPRSGGNLYEWTRDWYDEQFYTMHPTVNPRGPDEGHSGTQRRVPLCPRCAAPALGVCREGVEPSA